MGLGFSGSSLLPDSVTTYDDGTSFEYNQYEFSVTYGTGFTALSVLGFEYEAETYGGSIPALDVVNAASRIIEAETYVDKLLLEAEAEEDWDTVNEYTHTFRDVYYRKIARQIVKIAEESLKLDPNAKVCFA